MNERADPAVVNADAATIGRLRWRCRRGTRELDRLLAWYLDERFGSAGELQQSAFAALLEVQDPELWDWIMGRARATQSGLQQIIDDIRTHHRV